MATLCTLHGHDSCRRVIPERIKKLSQDIFEIESELAAFGEEVRKREHEGKRTGSDTEKLNALAHSLIRVRATLKYNQQWFSYNCSEEQNKRCRRRFIERYPANRMAVRAYNVAYENEQISTRELLQ